MNFRYLLNILRARKGLLFSVVLATVLLAIAVSAVLPTKYTAASSVVVDVKSIDPVAGGAMEGNLVSSYMATQIDIVLSERVALRALRTLGLQRRADLQDAWREATDGRGDMESWLANLLMEQLVVKPSRDSNVITMSFSSIDPVFSADMANAFSQAYIDTTLELKVEPARQYNSFFDARSKQMREQLEEARGRLSAYQKQKGIVATDERVDIENARLAELSSQLTVLQELASESSSRQAQAKMNADRMSEALANPVIAGLTAELSRQEARLTELNERLGSRHPQVQEARASIVSVRKKIADETKRVSSSLDINSSVNERRMNQVRAALEQQREKVLRLKGQRDEAAVLLRDVENAQRAYDTVLARSMQSGLESQNTQTNVSVLKRATVPAFQSSPRWLLNIAVALVLGVLLGIGAVVLREMSDRRLRFEHDVVNELMQPLLLTLPAPDRTRRTASRLKQIKMRVVRGLPRPIR